MNVLIQNDQAHRKNERLPLVVIKQSFVCREELLAERFNDSVDFLAFTRKPECLQVASQCQVNVETLKVEKLSEIRQN